MINIEIGDCMRRPDEQHTAVSIEGACIHGEGLLVKHPQVCGECIFYQKRKDKKKERTP